jgi:peptide/nickel transport system substrate-binding protein
LFTSNKQVGRDLVIPLFHFQNFWAARKGLKVEPLNSDRAAAMMVSGGK